MDSPMQEGPPDFDHNFFGFTNYNGVLHDHNYDIDPNICLETHTLRNDGPPILSHDLRLAASCLEAGVGIEVWALQIAWPGICNELSWFDVFHPDTVHPATIASINVMLRGEDTGNRAFDCPVFVAESRHGWPRTCNNVKCTNMAELRRHLTARAGRGYAPQLAFLELCPTCNDDFIDKDVFESRHGYRGELCNARRPQRRGASARVQWELLYRQVEAAMAVQRLASQEVSADSAPLQADSVPFVFSQNDTSEQAISQPTINHRDQTLPYLTPYQLIFDSDSDLDDAVRSPNTSLSSPDPGSLFISNETSASMPKQHSTLSAYESVSSCSSRVMVDQPTTFNSPFSRLSRTIRGSVYRLPSQSNAALEFDQIPILDRPESFQDSSETWTSYLPTERTIPSEPEQWTEPASTATTLSEPGSPSSPASPPEIYCDVEGCLAVFSGIYRKGNLARHKRLKHKGPVVYECEDILCDRVFRRQDARVKHYRRWHPPLASEYQARPLQRPLNKERYPDF